MELCGAVSRGAAAAKGREKRRFNGKAHRRSAFLTKVCTSLGLEHVWNGHLDGERGT